MATRTVIGKEVAVRPIVVLLSLLALAAGAAPAAAGTFHVYGLGLNGAGCGSGWTAESSKPSKFNQADRCSRWTINSNRDGQALTMQHWAGAAMYAGAGARFTGFSIRSSGTVKNGVMATVMMCANGWETCDSTIPLSGSWSDVEVKLGSLGGATHHARRLFAGVWCYQSRCEDSAEAGRAASVSYAESHAVVEDFTAPAAPSISGVSTGWNSGQQRLAYSATDAGSGVEAAMLTIDGSLHRGNTHSCARLPGFGYSRPVPCATSTSGAFAVNEPGQLADGRHTLTVTTRDASWETASTSQEFWVDNNAPGHPVGLAVEGGDGWRGVNDFAVGWENPDQGSGSGVVAAYYRVGSPPSTPKDGFRTEGGPTALRDIEAPADGTWPLYVWLEDEAGNSLPSSAAVVHLRLDTTPPSLAFTDERNEHDPAEIRVPAADVSSGVAGGQIEIRRQGVAEWRPLDTHREGTDLVTRVPDDSFERGVYELQATAWDAVGNRATTTRRADGHEMVVELPLRGDTHVSASLARRAGGAHRALPSIRVGYGRRTWLRGVLRSGTGTVLGDTRLSIFTRRRNAAEWRPFADVVTGPSGGYAVRLPKGPSRELLVHFPGTQSLRPSYSVAKLRVRGWASLRLSPSRLRRGRSMRFVGRVGLHRAAVPAGGKLVQIQYLDGRRWRPAVKLGRTNAKGRFSIRYRFRRISRPTKILFRILVPAEGDWPYATGASRVRKAFVRP